jgi:F0F1-type ATP synthase membrane subunit b/b'
MSCETIEKLRQEARELRRDLKERRDKARRQGQAERRLAHRPHSDFEDYLQRRIAKNAAEIARHVAQHRCE